MAIIKGKSRIFIREKKVVNKSNHHLNKGKGCPGFGLLINMGQVEISGVSERQFQSGIGIIFTEVQRLSRPARGR